MAEFSDVSARGKLVYIPRGVYLCRLVVMTRDRTSIKLEKGVRDRLRSQKSGGETYSQLIDKMVDQYQPNELDNEY